MTVKDEISKNAKMQLIKAEDYVNHLLAKVGKLEASEASVISKWKTAETDVDRLIVELEEMKEKHRIGAEMLEEMRLKHTKEVRAHEALSKNIMVFLGKMADCPATESNVHNLFKSSSGKFLDGLDKNVLLKLKHRLNSQDGTDVLKNQVDTIAWEKRQLERHKDVLEFKYLEIKTAFEDYKATAVTTAREDMVMDIKKRFVDASTVTDVVPDIKKDSAMMQTEAVYVRDVVSRVDTSVQSEVATLEDAVMQTEQANLSNVNVQTELAELKDIDTQTEFVNVSHVDSQTDVIEEAPKGHSAEEYANLEDIIAKERHHVLQLQSEVQNLEEQLSVCEANLAISEDTIADYEAELEDARSKTPEGSETTSKLGEAQ
ncbi:hypothetical protein BC829DRAFT_225839 [Chytridium lagenaria]|nr:hypothetical protein BC829DRAFT_225839 [Chytridium lagenaria]